MSALDSGNATVSSPSGPSSSVSTAARSPEDDELDNVFRIVGALEACVRGGPLELLCSHAPVDAPKCSVITSEFGVTVVSSWEAWLHRDLRVTAFDPERLGTNPL